MIESTDECLPTTQTELARWMAENSAGAARPVYPVGGRTALHYGYPAERPGMTLATSRLTTVVDYPARDMTVTVEAGIRIEDLVSLLAQEGQRLPIDMPQAHRATLGGVVATNTSGAHRYGHGTLRDYVIGISAVDATGRLFHSGGRVVKNVAGYDLCKLLVGSLGTLAVITQVTLKLRPIPESSALLLVSFDRWESIDTALEQMLTSAARPVALDVLCSRAAHAVSTEAGLTLDCRRPLLCVGVEGTRREVQWQLETLQGELTRLSPSAQETVEGAAAAQFWFALAEFPVSSEEPLTFKANLRPSRTVEFLEQAESRGITLQAHAGNGIVTGHLPDDVTSLEAAGKLVGELRQLARTGGGNLVVLQCDTSWKSELAVFGDPESSWPLMRQVKAALDPRNLLNPHRLHGPL